MDDGKLAATARHEEHPSGDEELPADVKHVLVRAYNSGLIAGFAYESPLVRLTVTDAVFTLSPTEAATFVRRLAEQAE